MLPALKNTEKVLDDRATHEPKDKVLSAASLGRAETRYIDAEPKRETEEKKEEQIVPIEAAQVIEQFNTTGILIRTLQSKNAAYEFDNLEVSVQDAFGLAEHGRHSGLRKWTLIHKDLVANYYKMGAEIRTMARFMAILASPLEIGDRYIEVYEKDAFSGNLKRDTILITQSVALDKIERLLAKLKSNQAKSPEKPLENNEIQTLGFSRGAVVAFMYKACGDPNSPQFWEAAKPQFQGVVNLIHVNAGRTSFHIFTYEVDKGHTSLHYLDTLVPK